MALTFEEHVTRAMLLGYEYDPRDHTYYTFKPGSTAGTFAYTIDADTLEPCVASQWGERRELVEAGLLGIPSRLWPHNWRPE